MPLSASLGSNPHMSISPDPSRILLVSPSYGYHGDLMYFGEIFRALAKNLPNLAIPVKEGQAFRNADGVPLVPWARYWTYMWQRKVRGVDYGAAISVPHPRFIQKLWAAKPDCVVAIEFTLPALMAMALACLRRGTGRVLLVESDPRLRGGGGGALVLGIKRLAARCAHVVQTNTPEGVDYITQVLGVAPERVRMAPYLTSCPPRPAGEPPLAVTPAAGPIRLLFVNSLQPRKGLDHLLHALGLLAPDVAARLSVTVVGDGAERAKAEAMARQCAVPVRFLGAKPYAEQIGRAHV